MGFGTSLLPPEARDPASNNAKTTNIFLKEGSTSTGGTRWGLGGQQFDYESRIGDANIALSDYQKKQKTVADELKAQRADRLQTQKALSFAQAAEGFNDFLSAVREKEQYTENADRNIRLIQEDIDQLDRDAESSRRLGRADAFQERLKGRQRADDSKLRLAAQGQKVSGQGVKRVSRSHIIASATRAAQRENASLERALGLEQEGVNLKLRQADIRRQKAYAKIQSNVKAFGGLVNAGIGVYSGTTA